MACATALVGAILVIGIPAASRVVARESEQEDPSFVVIDEVAGQLIALIGVPLRWQSVILGFILFRVFDIWKPPPLRRLERSRAAPVLCSTTLAPACMR